MQIERPANETEKRSSTPRSKAGDARDRKSLRKTLTTKPPNDLYKSACLRLLGCADLQGLSQPSDFRCLSCKLIHMLGRIHSLRWGREGNAHATL